MADARRQIDHRVALAGGLFDAPGVYAVLVGSGMSSAAGIPTGWDVAQELVRRVARNDRIDIDALGTTPEEWWEQQAYGELNYSSLIERLASTELARRALLRQFFEPGPQNPVSPSIAHGALAQLCTWGCVRVIITTNFDPLIERALEAESISPQVISNEAQVRGMTPLHHAPMTVIKVHGDYAAPELKNTDLELSTFDLGMTALLDEVFDRYGLLTIGWSGKWDHALRLGIQSRSSRRYPTYWAAHTSPITEEAQRLIAQQGTLVIPTKGADDLLPDLVERVQNIAQRANRRATPKRTRHYFLHPNTNSPQLGWRQVPLLTIRVAATLGPVGEESEQIGPDDRDKLVAALDTSKVVHRLTALQGIPLPPRYADAPSSAALGAPQFVPTSGWQFVPEANQNTEHAVYRLGGDGASGISAMAEVRSPGQYMSAGAYSFILDMGFSVEGKLQIETVAELIRTGLVTVTSEIPMALSDVLPPDSDINKCEIHIYTSTMNSDNSTRDNPLSGLIIFDTLRSWAYPSAEPGPQLQYAAELSGALSRTEAAELAVDAISQMAQANGLMDPRKGIEGIRKFLDAWVNL